MNFWPIKVPIALAVVPALLSNLFCLHFKWRLVREFLQEIRQQSGQVVLFDVVWFSCIQSFVTTTIVWPAWPTWWCHGDVIISRLLVVAILSKLKWWAHSANLALIILSYRGPCREIKINSMTAGKPKFFIFKDSEGSGNCLRTSV